MNKETLFMLKNTEKLPANSYNLSPRTLESRSFRNKKTVEDYLVAFPQEKIVKLLEVLTENRTNLGEQLDFTLNQLAEYNEFLPEKLLKFYELLSDLRDQIHLNPANPNKVTFSPASVKPLAEYLNGDGAKLMNVLKEESMLQALMEGKELSGETIKAMFDKSNWFDQMTAEKIPNSPLAGLGITEAMTGKGRGERQEEKKPRLNLTLNRRTFMKLAAAAAGFAILVLTGCDPVPQEPVGPAPTTEPTKKPNDGGEVEAATTEPETPEATAAPTETAEPTPTNPEAIKSLEAMTPNNYKVSQRFVDLLKSTMISPGGQIESVEGNVDVYLDNLLFSNPSDLEKFLNLLGEENPQLQEKLQEIIGVNNKTLVNEQLGISFIPNLVDNPNASTVLSLRYSEETGWLATLALVTNANSGYPVGSNLKITGDEFLVVAPKYASVAEDEVEQDQPVYTILMTEEVIDVLSSNGFPQSTANRYKYQVVNIRLTAQQVDALMNEKAFSEAPMRQLNQAELSAKLEEIANMNALEKVVWGSTPVYEFSASDFPELAVQYGNLAFEVDLHDSINEINDTSPYEVIPNKPENLFRFVASNLWLHCINSGQCEASLTLDEFIADMPAQTWKVVNAETQEVEEREGLNISKIKMIFTTENESIDNTGLAFPLFRGQTGHEIYISIQHNQDNPNELVVIAKYPLEVYNVLGRTNDGKNSNAIIIINHIVDNVSSVVLPDIPKENLMFNEYLLEPYKETKDMVYYDFEGVKRPIIQLYDKNFPKKN